MSTPNVMRIIEIISQNIFMDWNKDPDYTWATLPDYRKDSYRDWVGRTVLTVSVKGRTIKKMIEEA